VSNGLRRKSNQQSTISSAVKIQTPGIDGIELAIDFWPGAFIEP
jgi:hypothetical protein